MFSFRSPENLVDDDLELILVEKVPGNDAIGFVPTYRFEMVKHGSQERMGKIELRVGNTNHIVMYGGHIAYGVEPRYRGHRYASRGCKLLFPLARQHNLEVLWITCNPENIASARTCELAGGEFVEIVDLPENTDMYQEGERQVRRYRIRLEDAH